VSNLVGEDDGVEGAMDAVDLGGGVICRRAAPPDVLPALQMILGMNGQLAEESQAADFMRITARRGVQLSDIFVADTSEGLAWAVLPMLSPGRTMLLMGASVRFAGEFYPAVRQVMERVCRLFAARGVQLAQALLDPSDPLSIQTYMDSGFERMAELIYLHRALRRAPAPPSLPAAFQLRTYSEQTHPAFAAAIIASYENSLDCPPLNGLRDVEDIIAGHKSAGEFDPADWFVLMHHEEPVAVLLLSRTIHGDAMELVYLGISPQARGHGLGDHLMRVATHRVIERKIRRMTLAVDSVNAPALRLYHRHGLQRVASKLAMMRRL
jgi:ribosomal protein S18 acetylase RimI-like enzyme